MYKKAVNFIKSINAKVEKSKLGHKEIQFVRDLNSQIENTYNTAMSQFDLKTAISLLPITDDTEEKTTQLIDAIELYSDMLDAEGNKTLINFVLKTRLTATAKLRLESKYVNVKTLIKSMKAHL